MALEDIDLPRQGTHGYTPEDRLRAALAWAVTGTAQGASDVCGIPRTTIDTWTREEWWLPLVVEARQVKDDELDAKLTKVIDTAMQRLQERLDDPEGMTKAMLNQIAITVAICADKRQLLRGLPTSRTERVSSEDRINKLRDEFAGMMQKRADQNKVKTCTPDKSFKH